jgi:hypothetical protein
VIWVFAAVGVAMLPVRRQLLPGVALMLVAPVLIVLIGQKMGWIAAALALLAFLSMFRNPLKFIIAKLRGENPQVPQ